MLKLYRQLNILSIDVALGAFFTSWVVSDCLKAEVHIHQHIVLSLFVWLIYTFDQLMDVLTLKAPLKLQRRQFHQKSFKTIFPLFLSVFMLTVVYAVYALTFHVILYVGLCLFIVVCYFIMNFFTRATQIRFYSKEFIIALGYACGVCCLAFANHPIGFSWAHLIVLLSIAAFAFSNLSLIAMFEVSTDRVQKTSSIALWVDFLWLRTIIGTSVLIGTVLGLLACWQIGCFPLAYSLFLLIAPVFFFAILIFPKYFLKNERYRLLADAVFLIGGIPLILSKCYNVLLCGITGCFVK